MNNKFDISHLRKILGDSITQEDNKKITIFFNQLRSNIEYITRKKLVLKENNVFSFIQLSEFDIDDAITFVKNSKIKKHREFVETLLYSVKQDLLDYKGCVPNTTDEWGKHDNINILNSLKRPTWIPKSKRRKDFLKKWNEYVANNKIFKEKENS